MLTPLHTPDWSPFITLPGTQHAPPPRALGSPGGLGDRLRAVAFAECQAREAFKWAAQRFANLPEPLPQGLESAWMGLSLAEDRHFSWLMHRMEELKIDPRERPVSLRLWESYMNCQSAAEFSLYMASVEERGCIVGERFYCILIDSDLVTVEIFKKIVDEEIEYIALAYRFFPDLPKPR